MVLCIIIHARVISSIFHLLLLNIVIDRQVLEQFVVSCLRFAHHTLLMGHELLLSLLDQTFLIQHVLPLAVRCVI